MLLIKGGGIATCFETKGGESLYGPVRIQNAGDYFASPVLADGKIYVASENGNVVVLRNAAELEILSVNDLGSPVLGTPAVADGTIYFRTRDGLIAVGL